MQNKVRLWPATVAIWRPLRHDGTQRRLVCDVQQPASATRIPEQPRPRAFQNQYPRPRTFGLSASFHRATTPHHGNMSFGELVDVVFLGKVRASPHAQANPQPLREGRLLQHSQTLRTPISAEGNQKRPFKLLQHHGVIFPLRHGWV